MNRFVLLCVACAVASFGQSRKALVGGTLIDGYGGPPIRNSVILIEGEKIQAVGQIGSLPIPPGAEVISTEGMSILPGLWDMHVHTMLSGHSDYAHWDKTYPPQLESVIMPATAKQLLMAGVTSARDLGAPLEASIHVRDAIKSGKIPGATLYVSGPFLQHEPYPGTEYFRWGVKDPADGRAKVDKLADAGVDCIKLIDQDEMTMEEIRAIVDEAHKRKLMVVAHAHRPNEIRFGLEAGVDDFEHTGLATAPEYPADIVEKLHARTARGNIAPLWWTPTVQVLYNYDYIRDHPELVDDPRWHEGLPPAIISDIRESLRHIDQLEYFRMVPPRKPTLKHKFQQLRESGAMLLIGTDSGVPTQFHTQTTWNELDIWVHAMGVDPMDAIRAATFWPSVAMKVDKEVGTVTPGKYADIIAVRGDVLRYIDLLQNVDFVMKHGTRYK
ncbi:MAG: amidohydrolase family protein [Acidobacteriia bacterium]|nr:amidohydrolase family protein [Terriglobia bacterium]